MWVRMFICNQLHLRLDMASPGRYVWTEAGNGPASSNETSSVHITALTWFRCEVLSLRVILAKCAATGWRSAVLTRDVSPVWARALRAIRADPDVMLHAAKVSVWARWFVWLVGVVELAYRPGFWYAHNKSYLLLGVPLVAFNGFLHYRLRSNRTVTWRWLLFLSAMDIALITAAVIIGGEFHLFNYVPTTLPWRCSPSCSRRYRSASSGLPWLPSSMRWSASRLALVSTLMPVRKRPCSPG